MQHSFSFVADESVDFNLVRYLRNNGLSIFSILEEAPSSKDSTVLKTALEKSAILITEDKDFGELVFKLRLEHAGVLLLRTDNTKPEEKNKVVYQLIQKYQSKLSNSFSVIKGERLRIRKPL